MAVETLKFAVSPDITLIADRHGSAEGAPALLLHGGGQTRWSWDATARSLSTQAPDWLTVYSVDMRGHGQSGWCRNGNYRVDAFADDLRAVVTQLGVPPVIVGASLGGLAALLAWLGRCCEAAKATKWPDRSVAGRSLIRSYECEVEDLMV